MLYKISPKLFMSEREINNFVPDWQIKICQSVDLYFAKQNINLLSLKGQACIIIYRMFRIR